MCWRQKTAQMCIEWDQQRMKKKNPPSTDASETKQEIKLKRAKENKTRDFYWLNSNISIPRVFVKLWTRTQTDNSIWPSSWTHFFLISLETKLLRSQRFTFRRLPGILCDALLTHKMRFVLVSLKRTPTKLNAKKPDSGRGRNPFSTHSNASKWIGNTCDDGDEDDTNGRLDYRTGCHLIYAKLIQSLR